MNLHGINPTAPSKLRVYQFRHLSDKVYAVPVKDTGVEVFFQSKQGRLLLGMDPGTFFLRSNLPPLD